MAESTSQVEKKEDFGRPPEGSVGQWLAEIRAYDQTFEGWTKNVSDIERRYRNEEQSASESTIVAKPHTFNILWANIETLKPAIYSRLPMADITRTHKDKNQTSRAAAVVLERGTQGEITDHGLDDAMTSAVLDYLIGARGQIWARYVPTFGDETRDRVRLNKSDEGKFFTDDGEEVEEPLFDENDEPYKEEGEPYRPVIAEHTEIDHLNWRDFGHTPAPTWKKVRAVWKRELMSRAQLIKRFGKEIGEKVSLDKSAPNVSDQDKEDYGDVFMRAEVYEIWDKTSGKVLWISPGYEKPLDVEDDPLNLEGFFPCPEPLYGTRTTNSLVPVPDYVEYTPQARQIDELTFRKKLLIDTVKVAGCYDGESADNLQSLLTARDNILIPVSNWAMFAEKGGLKGIISFLPLAEIVGAIQVISGEIEQLKRDIYELTGLSDIVRGMSSDGAPRTAKEQGIKAQYAGMRISDRQLAVQKFARRVVRIVAEIVSEHFSPETLMEISGWESCEEARTIDLQYAAWEETRDAAMLEMDKYRQDAKAHADMMMQAETAKMNGQQVDESKLPPPPERPEMNISEAPPTSSEVFSGAVELLRSDRLRGFSIDIETDSMVLQDQQQERTDRIEFISTLTDLLNVALPMGEQYPEMKPALNETVMFGLRGFKAGRPLEQAFDDAIESSGEAQDNTEAPQPDPMEMEKLKLEQVRLQLEKMQMQIDAQQAQAKQAGDQQERALKAYVEEIKAAIEGRKLDIEEGKAAQESVAAMDAAETERMRVMQDGALGAAEIEADLVKTSQPPGI